MQPGAYRCVSFVTYRNGVGASDSTTSVVIPVKGSKAEQNAERNVVAMKLASEYSSSFGYNPLFLMGIVAMPLLMQTLNISSMFYIPLAVVGLSYLKADKDCQDRKSAIGIVSDYNVSASQLHFTHIK